ncbi:hypothetical protein KY284_023885 [Solanum tuberosum]|nr:hypothetical protein KY284_023885 [Solanum tuberosum]
MRYYHGGILNRKSREPLYEGGVITHIFDVDIYKMSYFELTNDIKELGYTTSCTFYVRPPRSDFLLDIQNDEDIFELSQSFKDGDIVEVYVCHMVDELGGHSGLLEYTSTNEKSFGGFNKEEDRGDHEGERVAYINENEFEAATTQPTASQSSPVGDPEDVAPTQALTNTTATVDPETDAPTQPTFNPNSDHEDLFNEGDAEYESDVHEENINLRDEKRSYQRRKRTKRVPKDPEEVPVAEVGPNVGFDETEPVDKNLKDNETRRNSRRIVFYKTTEKELMGDHVKEFGRIFYYRDELLRTNPGSTCVVKVDDSEDGCFLKGVTKGQLLVVVAKDANNQMLPTTWSAVEYENKNTWAWFLKLFIEDLGLGDGKDYTLISAMQNGLTSTINHLLPEVEHRCVQDIFLLTGQKIGEV